MTYDNTSTTLPGGTTGSPGGNGRLVTGLFRDRQSAEAAYTSAADRGYDPDDVNLVMSDETREKHFTGTTAGKETELGNKAAKGAGVGGTIGGAIGAVVAAVAAIGTSVALPGLGLVIAGPLAAAIAGAGAGAAGGGLVGALVGMGMPEERVKDYEDGVKNGGIMMGVHAKNDEDAAHLEDQWRTSGGDKVYR